MPQQGNGNKRFKIKLSSHIKNINGTYLKQKSIFSEIWYYRVKFDSTQAIEPVRSFKTIYKAAVIARKYLV